VNKNWAREKKTGASCSTTALLPVLSVTTKAGMGAEPCGVAWRLSVTGN
jgi:glyceraldehyde-3-phosphate dehydrogenase/erythrose-4-phosphate dehydrogenase